MTTFAFVAGMLPLVFSHGIGSGMSKAMASIVVGGQLLSLLLTLIAIPVIYSLFDSLSVRVTRRVRNTLKRITGKDPADRGESSINDEAHLAELERSAALH